MQLVQMSKSILVLVYHNLSSLQLNLEEEGLAPSTIKVLQVCATVTNKSESQQVAST